MSDAFGWLEGRREQSLAELVELLRIPSVSTAEAHVQDTLDAAQWVAARLEKAGLENIAVEPTGVHACVYADWLHAPGKPTVLVYGHFDVQPADPLELWESPPFEPVVKDGRIYARGATDMKGGVLTLILAAEALLATEGALPVNLKFLFEGQEEIGSRDLGPYVAAHREQLACDIILTPDGMQWADDQPALWMGTKGLCGLQIDLKTAAMDLHSGLYGGAVPNALHAMVELLGTMRGADGKILVEGFFDDVVELTAEERERFAAIPYDEAAYQTAVGATATVGEPGYTNYERTWARPTLELNGVWGGYEGDGVKTVIPAQAHAKITCRLVADQDPSTVLNKIEAHVRRHCPAGATVSVTRHASVARAYLVPMDDRGTRMVADVLAEEYGKEPYFARIGGSLPITTMFLDELGAYTVSVGFGLGDECMHSPNEFMRLHNFERGQRVYVALFRRLAGLG